MKAFKYLFIGALMLVFSAPVMAQDAEEQATIDQITKLILNSNGNTAAIADQVKQVYKKNKKKPVVLVAMGNAFKEVKDTAQARTFAQYALDRKNDYAPAYILLGDLEAIAGNGGKAAGYYNQAIYFDPQNEVPYIKYANVFRKVSPREAISKLNDLHAVRPDIEVDAIAARFLYEDNQLEKAVQTYNKVPLAKLERADLTNLATANYFLGKHADGLKVVETAIQRFPRHAPFNRLGMFFNYELKNYDQSLVFADRLFNQSDSTKISWMDYFYHGLGLREGPKNYDAAIEKFNSALAIAEKKDHANIIQSIYMAYSAKNDFDNALTYYNKYIEAKGNPSASDYSSLASMYLKRAESAADADKKSWMLKADAVYGEAIQKFPENEEYLSILRARLNASMDPELKEGLAKPYYERAAAILVANNARTPRETERLVECYRYLGWYYNEQANKEMCQSYWRKVLELDPANTEAEQFLK
ncbi:MAG: hypothetical protein IJ551_01460 [Prevotella sp.]|nr:hypothetical protein [Prevotella sp.]